jgi:predicted nucleic acid-binding protein
VAGELLLDTGGLVALLDRSQPDHDSFRAFYESWEGPVASTEAVLTEATHLLGRVPGGRETCVQFFVAGGVALVPSTPASLARCRTLLARWSDLPMDYADATLVVLAEDLATDLVFTTDRQDFRLYRIGGRREFRILPDDGMDRSKRRRRR